MAAGRTLPALTLVLGGARSGKSRYAEGLVEGEPGDCVFLATAEAGDGEMAERIRRHRERRGARWRTVEEPMELGAALARESAAGGALLVDCLTLWLSNTMLAGRDGRAEGERLVAGLAGLRGPVVMVSNEVGCGVVPDNELARRFQDEAGWLNQAVAMAADRVVYMVAGLPMPLKEP
jgi:adenosylcobinamide kinase/adenosylcobinamide-phosphate guanylyltransferase